MSWAVAAPTRGLARHRNGERRSRSIFACDGDTPAQHLDQPAADGQSQPCSTEPPRGRPVRLLERLKQARHLLGGHSDSRVVNIDEQLRFRVRATLPADAKTDLAMLRKLDGISR